MTISNPPDAPTPELLNKIEVTVGILEFEFTSYMQWVNKATSCTPSSPARVEAQSRDIKKQLDSN